MGIVYRQTLKTTIITFFGAVLGMALNILYTYVLTVPQLGYTKNIINEAAVIQYFSLLGIISTVSTFIPRYQAIEKKKLLLTISMFVPIIAVTVVSIFYFIFKYNVLNLFQPQDRGYVSTFYTYLPLLILFWSYITLFDAYLLSQIKTAITAFVREIVLRVCTFISLILLVLNIISFYYFIVFTVLSYLIAAICLFFISIRTKDFGFYFNINAINKREYKEILHFSWYHLLLGATLNLFGYVDSLMLGNISKAGLSSLAIYGTALPICSIMTIPYRAIMNSTFTIINKAYHDDDMVKLKDLFYRSSINILIIAVAMFAIIGCNLNNIVALLAKNKGFELIKPVILILMIGRFVDMATGLNDQLISIAKFYKMNFWISFLLIIFLISLCWILIPKYGMFGAAWASSICLIIFNIIKLWYLWVKLKIQPFSRNSLVIIFTGAVAAVIGYFLPTLFNPVLDAVYRTAVIVIAYFLLLYWLKPSKDLNDYIRLMISNRKFLN